MFEFIIWNGSSDIISIGQFALRWYGLLFALGFLVSQQILYYMYRKEGKPEKDVDTLTIYMIVATIIGARLGHVIFYQPEMLWESPLTVFLPFEIQQPFSFSLDWIRSWHFTGFQGLASHGAAIGILFSLWLYSNYSIRFSKTEVSLHEKDEPVAKKKKFGFFVERHKRENQSYLQVLDRIVILVCIAGCFIRLGNFFNSEILGKPSNSALGVVFVNKISEAFMRDTDGKNPVEYVEIKESKLPAGQDGRVPIDIILLFKKGVDATSAASFIDNQAKFYLNQLDEYVDEPYPHPLQYQTIKESDGNVSAKIQTFGIARLPAQLFESISCLILFLLLLWYWSMYKINLPEGRIFGIFMVVLWSLRFLYEFLKVSQVPFEDKMTYNMGQLLSIPMIIVGVLVLIRSFRQKTTVI